MATLILVIFASQLFVNVVVLGIVIWKAVVVSRHLAWSRDYMKDGRDLVQLGVNFLEITKTYAALVEQGRRETQAAVRTTAGETQSTVAAKAEEIKAEVRAAGVPLAAGGGES
jgi:nucleoside diphosphate kinase